jgi:type IV secretory pathway TrbF-like protein
MATNILGRILARSVPVPEERLDSHTERVAVFAVHNRWLRLALLGACAALVVEGLAAYKIVQAYAHVKPLVIRINDTGQVAATRYAALEYQPRPAEVRYFLTNFIVDHYSRVRATRRDAFQRQLFFMDAAHSRAAMDKEAAEHSIPKFLYGSDDEVDVRVSNVAIEDLQSQPFKASAQFEKVYLAASDHRELRRERYIAHFLFVVLPDVPNNFIPINPLGLVVTYFREDQAFE